VKEEDAKPDPWANLRGGSSLNKPSVRRGDVATQPIEIDDDEEDNYLGADSGSEFNGFDDDDDDAILIDSD